MNEDTWFGVGSFEDYPISPYGDSGDEAYERHVAVTDDIDTVQASINSLQTGSGGDGDESQLTAIYQAVTGEGQVVITSGSEYIIPAGQGANFRPKACKIIVLWTDAPFHNSDVDIAYPGPGFDQVVAALTSSGRRLDTDPFSSVMVIGISRRETSGYGVDDLESIALASGAIAGKDGVYCDKEETVFIPEGDPLVCTGASGGGAAIATAIEKAVEASFGAPQLTAKCRERVYAYVQSGCMAAISTEDIDNGSTGFVGSLTLDQSEFFALGPHTVTLTATDEDGVQKTCQSAVLVVDLSLTPDNIDCGIPIDSWHVSPCDMSSSKALKFTPTAKAPLSGCPVSITAVSDPLCERCNGSGEAEQLDCDSGIYSDGASMTIADTGGVGSFVRWSVTATSTMIPTDSVTVYCGVCVNAPSSGGCGAKKESKGKSKGRKGKARNGPKGKKDRKLKGKKAKGKARKNNFFERNKTVDQYSACPDTRPSIRIDAYGGISWPGSSLETLFSDGNCPL